MLPFASSCALLNYRNDENREPQKPAYESPYNFLGLEQINGRYTYSENDEMLSRLGIDVSDHQGIIDWETVAADGIEFAIIRLGFRGATEGGIYLDAYYKENIVGATGNGIPVGVYFFSQAINEQEARAEADFVLENLAGRTLDYPVAYDFEPTAAGSRTSVVSSAQLTKNAQAFCERIEEAGYSTMIYGNKPDIARYDTSVFSGREIWFAEYDAKTPSGQFDFTIWQYTSTALVAGIDTSVDMNLQFIAPSATK